MAASNRVRIAHSWIMAKPAQSSRGGRACRCVVARLARKRAGATAALGDPHGDAFMNTRLAAAALLALILAGPARTQYGDISDLKVAKKTDKEDVKSTPAPR